MQDAKRWENYLKTTKGRRFLNYDFKSTNVTNRRLALEVRLLGMPELPDVESFKTYFKRTSLHKKIAEVESPDKYLIKKAVFSDFRDKLVGKEFYDVERRGKFLMVEVSGLDEKLVFHFGMTGNFSYGKPPFWAEDFARVIFKFEDGYQLRWLNQRKLGKVYLVEDIDELGLLSEIGVEPLEVSKDKFLEIMKENSRKNIKSFLMSQRDIAGIGNIYSDEILFRAGVDPHKNVSDLKGEEREEIYKKMRKVLKDAIEIGPPAEEFDDRVWLIPHRHRDMICPSCGGELKRDTVAGRSAYFCPKCQK